MMIVDCGIMDKFANEIENRRKFEKPTKTYTSRRVYNVIIENVEYEWDGWNGGALELSLSFRAMIFSVGAGGNFPLIFNGIPAI